MPPVLTDTGIEDVVTMLITFVCSTGYIANPYLTAKLIEVMFVINPAIQPRTEKLNTLLLGHPMAMEHLATSLMTFYTGNV